MTIYQKKYIYISQKISLTKLIMSRLYIYTVYMYLYIIVSYSFPWLHLRFQDLRSLDINNFSGQGNSGCAPNTAQALDQRSLWVLPDLGRSGQIWALGMGRNAPFLTDRWYGDSKFEPSLSLKVKGLTVPKHSLLLRKLWIPNEGKITHPLNPISWTRHWSKCCLFQQLATKCRTQAWIFLGLKLLSIKIHSFLLSLEAVIVQISPLRKIAPHVCMGFWLLRKVAPSHTLVSSYSFSAKCAFRSWANWANWNCIPQFLPADCFLLLDKARDPSLTGSS